MDDLTLMRSFRAERAKDDEEARAEIWRALEARFDSTSPTPVPIATPVRRRGTLLRRRRFLAFAGATAVAAAVAGILVLSSGPTAQPAAAEILRETAAIAVSPDAPAPSPPPGPGQFFYRKFKQLQLQSWIPGGPGMTVGTIARPGAFKALMPTTQELWIAPEGAGRVRQVAGTPRFLTNEEQGRWEAAGSRLPAPFDPEYQRRNLRFYRDALEARRGVVDIEHGGWRRPHSPGTPRFLPGAETLRHFQQILGAEIDDDPSANPLGTKGALPGLFDILVEGSLVTPQRRAAAFNALAELPGIEVDTDSEDFLGRQGYAIRSIERKTGDGVEFIFDPDTSELLAQRQFIGEPRKGLPAGLTLSETAYLGSGVVDSTHETAAEGEAGGPVATTSPTYRK